MSSDSNAQNKNLEFVGFATPLFLPMIIMGSHLSFLPSPTADLHPIPITVPSPLFIFCQYGSHSENTWAPSNSQLRMLSENPVYRISNTQQLNFPISSTPLSSLPHSHFPHFEMVSLESSHPRFPLSRSFYSPASSIKISRNIGRSMRTIRSNFFEEDHTPSSPFSAALDESIHASRDHADSLIDLRVDEIAFRNGRCANSPSDKGQVLVGFSRSFTDSSACTSDISGELRRLASFPSPENVPIKGGQIGESELELGTEPDPFLGRESFSTEIIESITAEDLQLTIKLCVDGLRSNSVVVQRSAAAKLRLLAKNKTDNRILIGESGAVPSLIPLLRCSDPCAQEHAVTALFNLSLHESNKSLITNAGAIKSLVYVLRTGTETSKQNAACALLSLSLLEDNKSSIGVCGAVPLLVSLLVNGSNRGKKDALTTLYKLCTIKSNKERAVSAGAVKPLVGLVMEQVIGLADKAIVVLSSLAAIAEGRESIVEEGGISALVEAIEDGSIKGKEFAVSTLLQLCANSVSNRGLLVREGGIPPLVALSQTASPRAKLKSETLLGYLREQRQTGENGVDCSA